MIEISQTEYDRQRTFAKIVRETNDAPRTYRVVTYGCQMNARDSEKIAGILQSMGMSEREDADIIVFNTCCVRDNAERRALGNIKKAAFDKRNRTDGRPIIAVCGCMAQEMADTASLAFKEADIIFGTKNIHTLPELIWRSLTAHDEGSVCDIPDADTIAEDIPSIRAARHKAFVNITFGCDNFCTYCIVPYVRGRERSRKPDSILREAESLVSDGVKEVTLLGQNVNSYGKGLDGGASFASLLDSVARTGVERVRFMTSHPKDLTKELIETIARHDNICKHIHLPVQSGSDDILRVMNRGYDSAGYMGKIRLIREIMPNCGITSDIIVGFPGETDEDFAATLRLVDEVSFDAAYTFIYSPRKGTKAADMPGRVDDGTSAERINRLIKLQEEKTQAAMNSIVGGVHAVLVDDISKRDANKVSGKIGRAFGVSFTGGVDLIGTFANVKVTGFGHNTLKGEIYDGQ